jgi:hypothetical protein
MQYLRVDKLFPHDVPERLLLRICDAEFVCWIERCGGGPEIGPRKFRIQKTWGFLAECCNRVGNRLLFVIHVSFLLAHVCSYVVFLCLYIYFMLSCTFFRARLFCFNLF